MNTEDLIIRLAGDARAVTPLRSPFARLASWIPVAVVSIAAGSALYGVRDDRASMLVSPGFARDGAMALLVLILGAATALRAAVPGLSRRGLGWWSLTAAVAVWLVMAGAAVVDAGHGFAHAAHWTACAARAVSVALVPAGLLFVLIRRGLPLRPGWAFASAAASAMAAGSIAVQVTCPIADAGHILLGHVAPVVVMALLAAVAAPRISVSANPRSPRTVRSR